MAWLSMRSQNGHMVLRIEDIDPDRSRPEYVMDIMEDLSWLGLSWDEGPPFPDLSGPEGRGREYERCRSLAPACFQSLRTARYEQIIAELQERGLIYPCYCTRKELRLLASAPHVGDEGAPYPGTCRYLSESRRRELARAGRRPSLRLNTEAAARILAGNASRTLEMCFEDGVQGLQRFTLEQCGGDFALRRSDGVFAYQLAVVVDDMDMGITEVVRGEDLLLSTPRQLLLFALLRGEAPRYAHVPLLLDAHGERLAKRHKSLELAALRHAGVQAGTLLSSLASLAACTPGGNMSADAAETLAMLTPLFSFTALQGRKAQRFSIPPDFPG